MERSLKALLTAGFVGFALAAANPVMAAPMTWVFSEGDDFDSSGTGTNGNAGANETLTDGVDSVTLTTVDIFAPQFNASSDPTGVLLSTANGVKTLFGSQGALGINNSSIGDSAYQTKYGVSGESQNFNKDEAWVFEFDRDVTINELNWTSIDANDRITITVEGVATSYDLVDGTTDDDFADPLNGLVIPAGKNITMTAVHTGYGDQARLSSITVSVPEPASVGLAALGGLVLLAQRRRRN